MKYLITGAKGQLAKEFIKALEGAKVDFLALDRNTLDIFNFWEVMRVVKEYKPHVILNCAAYNYVDKAEADFHSAYKVNVQEVYNLALASLEVKAKLIHYSTDYTSGEKFPLSQTFHINKKTAGLL